MKMSNKKNVFFNVNPLTIYDSQTCFSSSFTSSIFSRNDSITSTFTKTLQHKIAMMQVDNFLRQQKRKKVEVSISKRIFSMMKKEKLTFSLHDITISLVLSPSFPSSQQYRSRTKVAWKTEIRPRAANFNDEISRWKIKHSGKQEAVIE